MITNSKITIYHKTFNKDLRTEVWERTNYDNVWYFNKNNASVQVGYDEANKVEIRIPYDKNAVDMEKIHIGDIIVKGHVDLDIEMQKDLINYEIHNITSISNNNFGNNPHLHLGGK